MGSLKSLYNAQQRWRLHERQAARTEVVEQCTEPLGPNRNLWMQAPSSVDVEFHRGHGTQ